jgi:hypothetical protein
VGLDLAGEIPGVCALGPKLQFHYCLSLCFLTIIKRTVFNRRIFSPHRLLTGRHKGMLIIAVGKGK